MSAKVQAEFASLHDYLEQALSPDERSRIGLITFNQWSFALGAVIETGLEAQELGSEVTFGFWADETPLRDVGWQAGRSIARLLGSRTRDQNAERALKKAGFASSAFAAPPISRWTGEALPKLPDPLTRAGIRALTYKGSDMGRSILQVHPNDQTPIRDSHVWPKKYVEAALRSYAWTFDQAQALIRQRDLRTVVVYNGRFTHDRAVAAAAKQLGIRVLYYDTGGYQTDFDLTTATTHDWEHLQHRMLAMYDAWDPDERATLGAQWFVDRQTHADVNNKVFTGTQTRGHMEGVPDGGTLVAFFSSSGDEIAELDLVWEEFLHSQEAALGELAAACRARPDTHLVVRTHPHMRLKPVDDLADWMAAVAEAGPDVHFDPTSPVDSYELMKRADIVFTYGSTSGVEAGFLGRPVVVMGPSAYDLLGCAQRITRADEIAEMLDKPPTPKPEAALPYGLMMQRRGFSYTHIEGTGDDISLGDVPIAEASQNVLKISDALNRSRVKRLTRA